LVLLVTTLLAVFFSRRFSRPILELTTAAEQITEGDLEAQAQVESHDEIGVLAQTFNAMTDRIREMLQREEERSVELEESMAEQERLQQEIINSQHRVIQELSTPVIPITDQVIVLPLIGSIDSMRARDITRALLAGISQHNARAVILDVTGVKIVDTGVANHLNKTIQAARLKGAHTIVTGISDAVAETIVDLGINWRGVETVNDLQTGLRRATEWIDDQHQW
jgi:anti-anti-sigma regulatory factor/HAMP domain-containing protein